MCVAFDDDDDVASRSSRVRFGRSTVFSRKPHESSELYSDVRDLETHVSNTLESTSRRDSGARRARVVLDARLVVVQNERETVHRLDDGVQQKQHEVLLVVGACRTLFLFQARAFLVLFGTKERNTREKGAARATQFERHGEKHTTYALCPLSGVLKADGEKKALSGSLLVANTERREDSVRCRA